MAPSIAFQVTVPALADPIVIPTVLEFTNAVVLAAKSDKGTYWRIIAALDIGAQELAALGETKAVDGGGLGEEGMVGDVVADFLDLLGDVAQEGCGAV